MDILDEIIANKRIEVELFKKELPFRDLMAKVEKVMDEGAEVPSMRGALMASDLGIISEFKRKSPSKGWIKEEGRADVIPLSYQQNGAADLKKAECRDLLEKAHDLQLEVLLEMHSEPELEYVELEPDMCGINNRNLGTFITKVENSFRLAELLPKDACKVSESGISEPNTVRELREAGFRGFLIGENFMKTEDPGKALREFIRLCLTKPSQREGC